MEARNSSGGLLTLQLGDTSSGFYVQEFTGLDPVKANIVSSSFANQDGAIFQSARRDTRNITIKIGLDPDPAVNTVRGLRQQLYNFFMPKSQVTMKFFVDDTDDAVEDGYQIIGRVETMSSAMFSTSSGAPVVDISIICFDPDFIDPVTVTNSSLTSADTVSTHFPYVGTSPTGLVFTLNINRTVGEFTLYYMDPNSVVWSMDVVMPGNFIAGDVVTISTVPGNKYATLTRSGTQSSILYAVSPQSTWPQFAPGDNWLRVYATGASMPASVSYNTRFGGL